MKRWLFVPLVLLALASPVAAQQNLLGDVQAERAKYPTPMTPTQIGQMLNAVAFKHRFEGWGLLEKGAGNSCPLAGRFISCDILVHAPSVTHWDVLSDSEGAATPQFNSSGPCVLSPSSGCSMDHFLAPVDPGGGSPVPVPTPTPVPVPVPTLDLSGLYSRIDWSDANNERRYQDLKAEAAAAAARDAALAAKVQAVYDKPGLVEEIIKSPYLYTIIGSILAGHYALPSK